MLHLCKLLSTFHHDHLEKSTATCPPINSALPMARPTVKPKAKTSSTNQKQGRPAKAKSTNKRVKKSWTSSFLSRFWPCLNSRQKDFSVTWFSVLLRSAPFSSLIIRFFCTSQFSPTFWFFLLGIDLEVFSINHLDFLVFFYQSPRGLEVFHRLIYWFSSTISR